MIALRRRLYEKTLIGLCIAATLSVFVLLMILIFNVSHKGYKGFWVYKTQLPIYFDPSVLTRGAPSIEECEALAKHTLRERFPEAGSRRDKKKLYALGAYTHAVDICRALEQDATLIGQRRTIALRVSGAADYYLKNNDLSDSRPNSPEALGARINEVQASWLHALFDAGELSVAFNWDFFVSPDSRFPTLAGIGGALIGSAYTLLITFLLAFPISILTAVYLQELSAESRYANIIEVVINNLAAVPSVIFGLLGLVICINILGMPRSSPLVGGTVLAMMTLPVFIISARAALRSVPDTIRDASFAMGATPLYTAFFSVLPCAMPSILTSTIIGMSRALGETAPLLLIGMVAFVGQLPGEIVDAATALPVQIFLWSDSPERSFVEKTSCGVIVLLAFVILMNLAAIILRQKMRVQW